MSAVKRCAIVLPLSVMQLLAHSFTMTYTLPCRFSLLISPLVHCGSGGRHSRHPSRHLRIVASFLQFSWLLFLFRSCCVLCLPGRASLNSVLVIVSLQTAILQTTHPSLPITHPTQQLVSRPHDPLCDRCRAYVCRLTDPYPLLDGVAAIMVKSNQAVK